MFILLHFLALLLPVASFAGGSAFVGNGGEGYLFGGRVILRDLVDYHWTPVAGPVELDPELKLQWRSAWRLQMMPGLDEGMKRELLGKLSLIERKYTGLGFQLLGTMNSYVWKEVPSEELIHQPAPGAKYPVVILAVRSGESIYLNDSYYGQLEYAQRVALILHEAIYALAQPRCAYVGAPCEQNLASVKRLTTHLMNVTPDSRRITIRGFSLSNLHDLCASSELKVDARPGQGLPGMSTRLILNPSKPESFSGVTAKYCNSLPVNGVAWSLRASLKTLNLAHEFETYRADFGDQRALKVSASPRTLTLSSRKVANASECIAALDTLVQKSYQFWDGGYAVRMRKNICPEAPAHP